MKKFLIIISVFFFCSYTYAFIDEGFSKIGAFSMENSSKFLDWNQQAVRKAQVYLDDMPFSKEGLVRQLIYEKFTQEQAKYAVEHINVDWNQQAVRKAQVYLDSMPFSKERLVQQLIYEKFSQEQATYAVEYIDKKMR